MSNSTPVTLVTSLFNLSDVTRVDDRKWDDYLQWFRKTLNIDCNFLIFTQSDVIDVILECRDSLNTFIIESNLKQIPYYYLKDSIQNILDSNFYKSNMQDNNRVECINSLYSIIQYSKFKWLSEASKINPFNSQYFFWVDAGISRFLSEEDYKSKFPSLEAIQQLNNIDDTFLVQYNEDYYKDLTNSRILPKSYFWDSRSFICGSMFGGNNQAIQEMECEIDEIMNFMIKNKCVNNEQIALGYLTKIREDLFSLFYRTDANKHLELFSELA